MLYTLEQRARIARLDDQVLGCVAVGHRERASRSGTIRMRELAIDCCRIARRDSFSSCSRAASATCSARSRTGGDQQRLRHRIVLGLGQKVGGDEFGVRAVIGDHQHFGRTRRQVEGRAVRIGSHQLLGGRDPGIAGAEYLADFGYAAAAIGHGGDGLGAADLEHLLDAAQLCGHQHGRVGAVRCAAAACTARAVAQPAMRAGTASMMTVEGSGARPAGTYRPTAPIGRMSRSQRTPGCTSSDSCGGLPAR